MYIYIYTCMYDNIYTSVCIFNVYGVYIYAYAVCPKQFVQCDPVFPVCDDPLFATR